VIPAVPVLSADDPRDCILIYNGSLGQFTQAF
jgi:hypothetical protein